MTAALLKGHGLVVVGSAGENNNLWRQLVWDTETEQAHHDALSRETT